MIFNAYTQRAVRGTSVTCHFDLGDGTSRIIAGSDDNGDVVTCEVTHLYTIGKLHTLLCGYTIQIL